MRTSIMLFNLVLLTAIAGSSCSRSHSGNHSGDTTTTIDEVDSSLVMVAQSSASSATTNLTHSDPLYYTPFNFNQILSFTYTPTGLTSATSMSNRGRFMFKSVASGKYLGIGTSGAVTANSTLVTYSDTLSKIHETIADASQPTWFQIVSELHGIYSLDADSSGVLSFANNRGSATSPANRGYVVFSYNSSTKLLQAKARYSYNLATYTHSSTPDASFPAQNWYVQENGGTFALVQSSGSATQMTLQNTPVDVTMPADFNPDAIAYQPNPAVPISSFIGNSISDMEGAGGHVRQNLDSSYAAQVAATGDDNSTANAASAMLDTIEASLAAEGARLRYPKALYLAFRKGALNTLLKSDGIANGTLGMNTVPYVYFTNAADDTGVHHPFMVIATYSIADKPNRLQDVSRPPGDGSTAHYPDQNVTRDATLQLDLVKIPLKDYGTISTLTENTLPATLNSDEGSPSANNVENYASTSGIGVAIDGVIIYPILNNTLVTAHSAAEITANGIHVGQGMGLHYHGDGHSVLKNDLNLYNIQDYAGQSHPPLIGFGLDGIALYGIYENLYPAMEGFSTGLDTFGGHTHGDLGYHYHAHTQTKTTAAGASYTAHTLMRGAWRGRINAIPEFWDTQKNEPAYSLAQRTRYVGKP